MTTPGARQAGLGTRAKADSFSQRGTTRRIWAGPCSSRPPVCRASRQLTSPRHRRVSVRRSASTVATSGGPGSKSHRSTLSPVMTSHQSRAESADIAEGEVQDAPAVRHDLEVDVAVDVPHQQMWVEVLVAELGDPAHAPSTDRLDDRPQLSTGRRQGVAGAPAMLVALDHAGAGQGLQARREHGR